MKTQREGRGVLFVANKTSDKQPDYKGEICLDQNYGKGTVLKIAGWKKPTPKNHLISISIDQRPGKNDVYPKSTIKEEMDDEVPF
jgi:hypothetical protein